MTVSSQRRFFNHNDSGEDPALTFENLELRAQHRSPSEKPPSDMRESDIDVDSTRTVLIVDDSRTIRLFVQRALEQAGIRAMTAGTASETIAALSEREPALMLLDLSVAEHDSKALLQRLTREGVFQRMRVVLFSNRVEPVLDTTAKRLGAAGYLRKTGDAREIVAAVSAFLSPSTGEK